jgi:PAS domain S-box-containing protein
MSRVDKIFETEETMRVMDESVINGRVVHSDSVFFPIRKEDGRMFAVGVVYRDITARVTAERAFVQSQTRQKAILDNISDIAWLKDLEGRYIDVNEAYCRFVNKTQDQIIGNTDFELWPEYMAKKYHSNDEDVVRRGKRQVFEEESLRTDGSKGWVETVKTPIFDGRGNVIGTTGIARDITDRKEAREALELMAMELEERVKQRTSELEEANEELVKQISEREKISGELLVYQKQLQSLTSELSLAEERLRRKIAVDVHDHIGQKLAVSKLKLKSLCQDSCGTDKASVEEVCEILSEAIDESRNLSFELSPPILYELGLCAAIEWLLRDMSEKHGIRGRIDCGRGKPVLDEQVRVILFQAVRELVFNVVKHSQARNLNVKIFCSDNQIEIEMSDDGIGFDISSIKDDNGVYRGFGLFSIKERLGHIGGMFEINSTLGSGTIATIRSPMRMGQV